mgnify:CR=1 FL=1
MSIAVELTDRHRNELRVEVPLDATVGALRNAVNGALPRGYVIEEHDVVPKPFAHYVEDDPECFRGPADGWRLAEVFFDELAAEPLEAVRCRATAPLGPPRAVAVLFPGERAVTQRDFVGADAAFLEAVNAGRMPAELGDADTDVHLVDKSGEPYKAPPPTRKPFSGEGRSMRDDAGGSSSGAAAAPVGDAAELCVDESQPTTTLQVRADPGATRNSRRAIPIHASLPHGCRTASPTVVVFPVPGGPKIMYGTWRASTSTLA